METKKLIFVFIAVLIIAGLVIIGFYIIKNMKPKIEEPPKTKEILVDAIDERNNKRIISNFTVTGNDTVIYQGITLNNSYQKIIVPDIYKMYGFYLISDKYYSDFAGLIGNRINIEAHPIGNLSVNHTGNLTAGEGELIINVTTDYNNRELSFCLDWSTNVIKVENTKYQQVRNLFTELECLESGKTWIPEKEDCDTWCKIKLKEKNVTLAHCETNYTKTLPPQRLLGKVNICYYVKRTITKDEGLIFTLKYKAYQTLRDTDYIKLYIIDSNNNLKGIYTFEDENFKDTGAKDFVYMIYGNK